MPYSAGYAFKASRPSPEEMRSRDCQRAFSAEGHGGYGRARLERFNTGSTWQSPVYDPVSNRISPYTSACDRNPPGGQLCQILVTSFCCKVRR